MGPVYGNTHLHQRHGISPIYTFRQKHAKCLNTKITSIQMVYFFSAKTTVHYRLVVKCKTSLMQHTQPYLVLASTDLISGRQRHYRYHRVVIVAGAKIKQPLWQGQSCQQQCRETFTHTHSPFSSPEPTGIDTKRGECSWRKEEMEECVSWTDPFYLWWSRVDIFSSNCAVGTHPYTHYYAQLPT